MTPSPHSAEAQEREAFNAVWRNVDEMDAEATGWAIWQAARASHAPAAASGEAVDEGCTPTDAKVLRMANHQLASQSIEIQEALRDLLSQVNSFCESQGEADFETGRASELLRRLDGLPPLFALAKANPAAGAEPRNDQITGAYWQGWCEASDWAQRDDLYADRDSQAYQDAMKRRLGPILNREPATSDTAAGAEPACWALRFPEDPRICLSTVFDTELEAQEWATKCGHSLDIVVPLYLAPPATSERDAEDARRLDWLDATNARFRMGWEVGMAPAGNVSVKSVIFAGSVAPVSIRDAIDAQREQSEKRSGEGQS